MASRFVQFAIVCTVAVLAISCAPPGIYKLYEGPKLPSEKIAVLKNSPAGRYIYIELVDGIPPPTTQGNTVYGSYLDGSFRIELLPGKHTLSVKYYCSSRVYTTYSIHNQEITFYAEAGKVYTVKGGVVLFHEWEAWVEEIKWQFSPLPAEY